MPAAPARMLDRLRSALDPDDHPNARLVTRFARDRDDAAFAELVRRHGPMVLAVCRRVVGDAHLAEDAFQATFLVLARRAAVVRPRAAVGAFLHGVATRTARDARAMIARRRQREVPAADPPAADPYPAEAEVFRALDEEVSRLPDHLRAAVVLCELEGRPRNDVAADLGVPEGTLSSRLAKARKLLADRLRQRGFALPATLVAAAAVPPGLAAAASGSFPVSSTAARLAGGVFRVMFLKKLAGATATLAVVCAAVGWSAAGPGERPAVGSEVLAARRAAPVPKPAPREGVILVTTFHRDHPPAELLKPDGSPIREVKLLDAGGPWKPRLSPDGKRVLVARLGPLGQEAISRPWTRNHIHVVDLDAKGPSKEAVLGDVFYPSAVWSADGRTVYGSSVDPEKLTTHSSPGNSSRSRAGSSTRPPGRRCLWRSRPATGSSTSPRTARRSSPARSKPAPSGPGERISSRWRR